MIMDTNDDTTKPERNEQPAASALSASPGSHPRVEAVLHEWLRNEAHGETGLFLGSDKDKAAAWQKAASKLERIARQLEEELSSANTKVEHASRPITNNIGG